MTRSEGKDFEAHRSFLAGLAYRMLGSIAEAEDVVQDAYLRWAQADAPTIVNPRAYLARVADRKLFSLYAPAERIADFTSVFGHELKQLTANVERFVEKLP